MNPNRSFRPDIEGLRGVAVLCVVVFHASSAVLPGGFVGVDVFFVLSGYLITGLLVSEAQETSTIDLRRFYARRVRRLLPAATVVTLLTLSVGALVMGPGELLHTAKAARATAAYLSNYYFALNSQDYFAENARLNPVLHTWSLGVEEQFYFFWPLLILLWSRRRAWRNGLPYALGALTFVSFAASAVFTTRSPGMAFYGLPTRVWEFSIGALALVMPRSRLEERTPGWLAISWTGLCVILLSARFTSAASPFPGWLAAFPVAGTVLVLRAGSNIAGALVFPLHTWAFQLLGRLSYSWYLWHWPFLIFTGLLFPGPSVTARVVAVLLALVAAAALHFLLENRVRFHPALVARPLRGIGLGILLSAVTFGAAMATMAFARQLGERDDMRTIERASRDIGSMAGSKCVTEQGTTEIRTCSFGPDSAEVVVLFGDSHAVQWFDAVRAVAEARGWRLVTALRWACPPMDVQLRRGGARTKGCTEWRDSSIAMIARLRPVAVILSSSVNYLNAWTGADPAPGLTHEEWQAGTHRTLAALAGIHAPVVLIHDNPRMGFHVPSCVARARRNAWFAIERCTAERLFGLDPRVLALNRSEVQQFPNTRLLDLSERYCSPTTCPALVDDAIVYRDDTHLTAAFALRMTPYLDAAVDSLLASRPPLSDPPSSHRPQVRPAR